MVLYAEKGKINLSLCVFSLKYLVKSCKLVIPAICIDRESKVALVDSEVKGNEQKETIGILCRLGSLEVRGSVISYHKEGGVIVWGNR